MFVLLKRSFWGLFGAIWVVAGAMFLLIGVVTAIRDGQVVFPIVGVIITTIGCVLLRRGVVQVRREQRLLRVGVPADATVTAVEETSFRVNRQRQWIVHYRYTDPGGRPHEGKSGYLNPEEAQLWEEGQSVRILFDPDRPSDSMWHGNVAEQLDEP